jgi:hypothetical protein
MFLKKIFFNVWRGKKMCFDAFTDHQNQVLKNLFFHVFSGEKRVLRHFPTTRIKSLKNYFLTSGVAKNVF